MQEQPHSPFELVTTMDVRDQSYVPAALAQGKSPNFHIAVSCVSLGTSLGISEKRKMC